jgi:hypothetical protein
VLNIHWLLKMHGGACRRSPWDGVDMQVEVIGGQVEEIGQGQRILALRGRFRAYALGIAWPLKLQGGGHIGSGWDDVDTRVDMIGAQVGEIGRGQGILAPRGKYRAYALSIAWPSKMCGGGCRGSVWVGADMWVWAVGGRDEEIAREWGFGPAKPKTEHNGLGIRLVLKQITWEVADTYGERGKERWWW